MNNSTIEGLTKQEETLFLDLINKILAQKLLPEASFNSTEKQFQLNLKVDENGSIDLNSIQLQLEQIKPLSLFEKSSTSTEKQLQSKLKIEEDENISTEIDSLKAELEQPKSTTKIISTVFYVISFATFTLGFVVIPGIIIWIVTNSVILTIFALIGWIPYMMFAVGLFNGKTNWMMIISAFIGYFITLLLVTLLGNFLSF